MGGSKPPHSSEHRRDAWTIGAGIEGPENSLGESYCSVRRDRGRNAGIEFARTTTEIDDYCKPPLR